MALNVIVGPDAVSANVEGVSLIGQIGNGSGSDAVALLCSSLLSRQLDAILGSVSTLNFSLAKHPAKLDGLVAQIDRQNQLMSAELRASIFAKLDQLSKSLVHEADLNLKFSEFRSSLMLQIDEKLAKPKE